MDVDGESVITPYGTLVNTLVISAEYNADLTSNTVEVSLPYQIPNCYAIEVEHFSMVDDGTPLAPFPNGTILVLRSDNLCSGMSKNRFFMSQTNDLRAFQMDIYNNVLGWTCAGRKNSTSDLYPLGLPQRHRKCYFDAEQMVQRFRLNIDNINTSLKPHTTPFTLQIILTLYSRA